MEKRPYAKPRIFRVVLNHEQAVLSQCSVSWASTKHNQLVGCEPGRCRKARNQRRADSAATS